MALSKAVTFFVRFPAAYDLGFALKKQTFHTCMVCTRSASHIENLPFENPNFLQSRMLTLVVAVKKTAASHFTLPLSFSHIENLPFENPNFLYIKK